MEDTKTLRFSPSKCPVCNGFGTVKHGQLICGACNGKGYVVLDQLTGLPVEHTNNENPNRMD